jgi:hypothetical protein
VLYKNVPDLNSLASVATKVGLSADKLFSIFDTCMEGQRDSLCIDLTANSPAKMRVNGYKKIREVSEGVKKNRNAKYENC